MAGAILYVGGPKHIMQAEFLNSELIRQQATVAGFGSVEDYLVNLVHQDIERQAIKQALDELDAGLGRPLEDFDAEFRARHSIDATE